MRNVPPQAEQDLPTTSSWVVPPPERIDHDDDLLAQLANEMNQRWAQGDRVLAEEFLDRHPLVKQRPEAALELVYEEICLRKDRGEVDFGEAVLARFPQWRRQLEVMLECHRLLESSAAEPKFPQVGETVADCQLLEMLGRGASGCVFLASQADLADRLVVLKISARSDHDREHLHLARLQHTHIVPLYAVHDEPARDLRILCMPYFGRVTLARLQKALAAEQPGSNRLPKALKALGVEPAGPAGAILKQLSHEQALCWIGACLADALAYAHAGGLLHLDVKPSNILIADNGQPMLLDFHLARGPVRLGDVPPDGMGGMGGTPGYMAPEQDEVLQALNRGNPVAAEVDQRADVYGLGAVLYEALGGKLPYRPGVSPPLSALRPEISMGLSDIVAKCLASRPSDRYASAALLAADLRCHLSDQPLRGVRNRSWSERVQKWRRRRPNTLGTLALIVVLVGAIGAVMYGTLSHWRHLNDQAAYSLEEGRKNWRERQRFPEAIQQLRQGLALAQATPWQQSRIAELTEELQQAELAQARDQQQRLLVDLHALAEQVRAQFGADHVPRRQIEALNRSCQNFWAKRQLVKQWVQKAASATAEDDLLDLMLFTIHWRIAQASAGDKQSADREILATLDEAAALFGESPVLDQERQRYRQALHLPADSPHALRLPKTAWEHMSLGRSALLEGEFARAAEHLDRALELQPAGFWPNYLRGQCAYRLGQYADAVAALSVCIGASPEIAGSYYNRALAFSALGKEDLALRDYNQALRIDPQFAGAALNRGILYLQAQRFAEAAADLQRALRLGAAPDHPKVRELQDGLLKKR